VDEVYYVEEKVEIIYWTITFLGFGLFCFEFVFILAGVVAQ
jgi:hypothetical protein